VLFLLFSTPTGLHHQFADPGIHEGFKVVHTVMTFAVFFPSLLTFFNVVASLEIAGRARGGKGLFRWFTKLPWGDPSLAAQVFAMLLFAFGGIGGLVNASMNLNLVVHNTAWIPGHLHLTVGTAVALSFMGITYWLVPLLAGRALWSRRVAQVQVWSWLVGMVLFSNALHRLGLMGAPRRTMLGAVAYAQPEWSRALPLVGIGGAILFVSSLLYFVNMIATAWLARRAPAPEVLFAEAVAGASEAPAVLERWGVWIPLAVVLVLLAYGPPIAVLLSHLELQSPGFKVW
jgi:cytochrome c oxidase subunit 1